VSSSLASIVVKVSRLEVKLAVSAIVIHVCRVQGPCMNVCYVLQTSDKSRCCMNVAGVSSLYTTPRHFDHLTDVLADTNSSRLTFAGKVIHSVVRCPITLIDWLRVQERSLRALTESALDDILRLLILRYTNVRIDW